MKQDSYGRRRRTTRTSEERKKREGEVNGFKEYRLILTAGLCSSACWWWYWSFA